MRQLENQAVAGRKVKVNRVRLLDQLKANKEKHIEEYNAALAAYRDKFDSKLKEACIQADRELNAAFERERDALAALKDDDIPERRDIVALISAVHVEMPVPRSYAEAYSAAIDMVEWETSEIMELTATEFNCFVRDKWDWKPAFETITKRYSLGP